MSPTPKNRGVLSGPLLVYLIGDWKTEGKCCIKTWTAILAEIFQPRSPKVKVVQEGSGDNEGGISRERESDRQRDKRDFDLSYCTGHDHIAKHVSVLLEDI